MCSYAKYFSREYNPEHKHGCISICNESIQYKYPIPNTFDYAYICALN